MKRFDTRTNSTQTIKTALKRGVTPDAALEQVVDAILAEVQKRGDDALLEYTRRFDSENVSSLEVTPQEFESASQTVPSDAIDAIEQAAQRIEAFHQAQLRQSWLMTTEDGGLAGQQITPLERIGAYVPGGKAIYPSSVLMNCLPAKVAGVKEILICAPPMKDGSASPFVLMAAKRVGNVRVFKVGGAQAVGAFAFGTESIPRVDKIVGPGNRYVTLAKRKVYGAVGIDTLAGSSEVCVIADARANPRFVAADLLVQIEHAEDCSAFLLSPDSALIENTFAEIEKQVRLHPRESIMREALKNSACIHTRNLEEAFDWSNWIAPEHLSVMTQEPISWLPFIKAAGAVLLGDYSPQSLGDYAAGPSHTLPTETAARFSSPLNVDDFVKKTSVIYYQKPALQRVYPVIEKLGQIEGFDAHVYAARIRLEEPEE